MDLTQELYLAEQTDYKRSPLQVAGNIAATAGTTWAAIYLSGKIKNPFSQVGNLRYINDFTILNDPWYQRVNIRAEASPTIKIQIWNAIKAAEEQLFRIPRAFSLSAFIGESVYRDALKDAVFDIPAEALEKQSNYLNLISRGKITSQEIAAGVTLDKGVLYSKTLNPDGTRRVLLEHANIVPNFWARSRTDQLDIMTDAGHLKRGYAPGIWRAMHQQHGITPPQTDFLLVGGHSKWAYRAEKTNAMLTKATQNFMKLMDDPFELLHQMVEGVPFVDEYIAGKGKKAWEKIGMRNLFGVGGYEYTKRGNWAQLFARHAKRGLPLLALGIAGYKLGDELLRSTPIIEDTGLGAGIKGNIAKIYQDVTKVKASVSQSLGLTTLTKKQEEKAPGSTSLFGLAAFPATLSIFGGTVAGIENIVRKAPVGEIVQAPEFLQKAYSSVDKWGRSLQNNLVDAVLDKANLTSLSKVKSYALTGALIGTAAVLGFLPGALGSDKTPQELEEIYSGRERVEYRRGKWWEFGTSPIEGGDIEYFGPHWTVRSISDATKKGVYGDYYGKPITRFFKRMFDPYYLERSMDEERPYTYWGPTDHGLGIFEQLAQPIKELFKPTILAHPEALEAEAYGRSFRGKAVPQSLEGTPLGYSTSGMPEQPVSPDSAKLYARDTIDSALNTLGLHGFAFKSIAEKIAGERGFLSPALSFETSGRITSAERMYWNMDLGGGAGSTEFYRRLNQKRDYDTEYLQSPLRNTMPEWIPEHLRYGDPYTKIKSGELRLPGAGYEALYPEISGLSFDEYPSIHKLNILSDVAPTSSEYYRAEREVQDMITSQELSESSRNMYAQILRERDALQNDYMSQIDTGEGVVGSYWLTLKQLGRSLPTESLYPFSPAHKFMGPVDPVTEYKSTQLLDKRFKIWSNPISDYMVPAFNRTIDVLSFGNYIPPGSQDENELSSYFYQLQYAKNKILEQNANLAADSKDYEAASYFRSGIRPTLYGQSPYEDINELAGLIPDNQRNLFLAMAHNQDNIDRQEALRVVPNEWKSILSAQWNQKALMQTQDFETISQLKRATRPIGEQMNVNEMIESGEVPGRDFTGYAPGVDLNAFKVKVATNLGQNIRDHNLWREDERRAIMLDKIMGDEDILYSPGRQATATHRDTKRRLNTYLNTIGMRDAQIVATPVIGDTYVDLKVNNNRSAINKYYNEKQYSWNA